MLDLKKLLTKMLQELKYAKLNTSGYISSSGNTVSFTQDVNTGQISVSSQAIVITPNQISGTIPANKVNISVPTAGTAKPKAVGTSAVVGTATTWSKSDHVHNITGNTINSALGYTPYDSSNPDGFGKITEIASTSPIVGSGTTGTITLSHSASGVTSGVYGSTADQSPTFGSSVIVPNFNVNNTGHLTTASTSNIIIPSNTFTAATTAVEGNVGLVPAASTATTATFGNVSGLSNYWLNANGDWVNIPTASASTKTVTGHKGLMDIHDVNRLTLLGMRGKSQSSSATWDDGRATPCTVDSITNNTPFKILFKYSYYFEYYNPDDTTVSSDSESIFASVGGVGYKWWKVRDGRKNFHESAMGFGYKWVESGASTGSVQLSLYTNYPHLDVVNCFAIVEPVIWTQ